MKKLKVAFRNFARAAKIRFSRIRNCDIYVTLIRITDLKILDINDV